MARSSETKIVVDLVLRDWETPEELAKTIIKALDEDRAKRLSYVAVMQFGNGSTCFYHGLGPYAGVKGARRAVEGFPGASEAKAVAVVPMTNKEGLTALLKNVG